MTQINCNICLLHRNNEAKEKWEIGRNEFWVLRHHPTPSPLAGWFLLDSLRHIKGPIDFNTKESSTWGAEVQRASQLIQKVTHCERVYLIAFGEGAPHLHLHLIPRFNSDPKTNAWNVADYYRKISTGINAPASSKKMYEIIRESRKIWK